MTLKQAFSIEYASPEQIAQEESTIKGHSWAVGILLF